MHIFRITEMSFTCQIYDQYDDKWEIIRVLHAPLSAEEEAEREEALAEVADPNYLNTREDADADGEVDDIADENDVPGMRPHSAIDIVSEL